MFVYSGTSSRGRCLPTMRLRSAVFPTTTYALTQLTAARTTLLSSALLACTASGCGHANRSATSPVTRASIQLSAAPDALRSTTSHEPDARASNHASRSECRYRNVAAPSIPPAPPPLESNSSITCRYVPSSLIIRSIASKRQCLRQCYEDMLRVQPDASGRVRLELRYDVDGVVRNATAASDDLPEPLLDCLAIELQGVQLSGAIPGRAAASQPFTVAYPMRFKTSS